jgi:DNA repair exonuclease SbcCD ATPase subunit
MQGTQQRRGTRAGISTIGIVVGLVVVLLIGGVTWYFVSDRFRTSVDSTMTDLTKWTPEAIAKDPQGYLNFAETEAKKTKDKLRTSEVAANMSLATLESRQKEEKNKVQAVEAGLDKMRDVNANNTSDTWPVTFDNRQYSKDEFRLQAKRFATDTKNAKQRLATIENGLARIKVELTKIREAQSEVENQLDQIRTHREELRVKAITDDITKQLVDMKGVLASTAVTATNSSSVVSADQYVQNQSVNVSDAEFDALMKK